MAQIIHQFLNCCAWRKPFFFLFFFASKIMYHSQRFEYYRWLKRVLFTTKAYLWPVNAGEIWYSNAERTEEKGNRLAFIDFSFLSRPFSLLIHPCEDDWCLTHLLGVIVTHVPRWSTHRLFTKARDHRASWLNRMRFERTSCIQACQRMLFLTYCT